MVPAICLRCYRSMPTLRRGHGILRCCRSPTGAISWRSWISPTGSSRPSLIGSKPWIRSVISETLRVSVNGWGWRWSLSRFQIGRVRAARRRSLSGCSHRSKFVITSCTALRRYYCCLLPSAAIQPDYVW